MNKTAKPKTASLVILLITAFAITSLAGLQFVSNAVAAGYTETVGTLGGAHYVVRFPDTWNGMLVVFCRGFSHPPVLDARSTSYNSTASGLLGQGYAVAASAYGAGGYCIQTAMNDTYQLTKYLVNTYHITGKVFLIGASMGGNVALMLGEKYPNVYSGVLDMYGSKDIKNQYETKVRWANLSDAALTAELTAITAPIPPYPFANLTQLRAFSTTSGADIALETGGTPANRSKAYEDISPTYHANISIPVLTVHGTSDALVPLSQTLMYQDAVAKAGRLNLYRLYTVVGGQHANPSVNAEIPNRFAELVAWSDMLSSSFSIMQISDTQHLAFLSPTLYNDTTSWIVNNSAIYNLKMVIHTGDFVDAFVTNPPPPPLIIYNASQMAQEWAVANAAMSKLQSAGIPYCWDAGNHDQTPFANASGTMIGSSYSAFNATAMRSKPYWVSDIYDSKNTAVKFTYNNYPFLIINLEYLANNSALAWMKTMLAQNTGANVIIATHNYLNATAGYSSSSSATTTWNNALKATLDSYPNVFLALCGHVRGPNMTRVGNRQEILFDPQEENNQTGAASVRIYTFNLTAKEVIASTYSVDTKTWLTDNYNQFTFSASTLIPLATSAPAASAFCNVTLIGGGTWYFFAHSNGGFGPHSYQWYEGSTLLAGQTSMVLPITKTSLGVYTFYCRVTDSQGTTTTSNPVALTVVS